VSTGVSGGRDGASGGRDADGADPTGVTADTPRAGGATPALRSPPDCGSHPAMAVTASTAHRHLVEEGMSLPAVVERVRRFLRPPTDAIRSDEAFDQTWEPGGPWGDKPPA
jgi:hypothetical protein